MGLLKRIFGKKEKDKNEEEAPGRTFKRILIGDYFGLRNPDASDEAIQRAKEEKVRQIEELGLKPVYLRYRLGKEAEEPSGEEDIEAVYVAFQKEEYDPKHNMVHVTEISFIVSKDEFEQFEKMAGVSLEKDFRNLYDNGKAYEGINRRKQPRKSPFEEESKL